MQLPDLLTSSQAAKLVGCKLVTIRQNVARKNLRPYAKIGGTYLFTRAQVEKFREKFQARK